LITFINKEGYTAVVIWGISSSKVISYRLEKIKEVRSHHMHL